MILPGKNLIISRNGEAMFASKSCDVNIQTETIPASSPTDGSWVHRIAGRKSWSLITNHLMGTFANPDGRIVAQSFGHNGFNSQQLSFVIDGTGAVKTTSLRGISVINLAPTAENHYAFAEDPDGNIAFKNWDTYETVSEAATDEFLTYLHDSMGIIALVAFDAMSLPQTWVNYITTYMNVTPPVCSQGRHSLAVIGGAGIKGTYSYFGDNGKADPGSSSALAELDLYGGKTFYETPVKDATLMVGSEFTMKCSVLGLPYDEISGPAICKQFRVTGTRGNLLQGSFSFEGSGPLE